MKKMFMALCVASMTLVGCAGNGGTSGGGTIQPVSREEGSGTRGAFVELVGLEENDQDMTTTSAEITNSTSVMITTVQGNENAIGYISLGSLNDDVKAVKVDGVEATADNVKNGTYKLSRPFNIVTKDGVDEVTQDFIKFILSDEGQAIVEENGCVSQESTGAYEKTEMSGKIVIGGSSSVTPVMEKLKEAYVAMQPNVTIDIQQTDSSSGASGCVDGLLNIGMLSREVKDSELEQGLKPQVIALDGIAVIVNKNSSVSDLTTELINKIFKGELKTWDEVK